MILRIVVFFFLLFPLFSFAQIGGDSIQQYYQGFPFKEGVYLSIDDFKTNNPSFQGEFERRGSQLYIWDDSSKTMLLVKPQKIWGYAQVGNIYISYEGAYWRILNMGELSHFSAIVVSTFETMDNFGFLVERQSKSMEHLFVDMKSGAIKSLNYNQLKRYLESDSLLSKNLKKGNRKNDRDLILKLRAYNDLHPIYFPTYE